MIQSSLPNTDRIRIRTCLLSFALPSNIVMHDIDNAAHMKSPDTNESLAPLPGSEVPFVDDNFTHELDQGQSYFENDPFWSFTGQQAEASAVAGDEWTSKDGIGPVLPPDSRLFTKASSSCGTSNSLADSRGPALGPSAPKLIDVYGERSASSALVDLGAQPLAAERAHKDSGQVTQTLESHRKKQAQSIAMERCMRFSTSFGVETTYDHGPETSAKAARRTCGNLSLTVKSAKTSCIAYIKG